jgi:hypothetical protein
LPGREEEKRRRRRRRRRAMGEGWGCWWLTDREAEEREPESGRSDELALAVDNVLLLGRGRRGERERGGRQAACLLPSVLVPLYFFLLLSILTV